MRLPTAALALLTLLTPSASAAAGNEHSAQPAEDWRARALAVTAVRDATALARITAEDSDRFVRSVAAAGLAALGDTRVEDAPAGEVQLGRDVPIVIAAFDRARLGASSDRLLRGLLDALYGTTDPILRQATGALLSVGLARRLVKQSYGADPRLGSGLSLDGEAFEVSLQFSRLESAVITAWKSKFPRSVSGTDRNFVRAEPNAMSLRTAILNQLSGKERTRIATDARDATLRRAALYVIAPRDDVCAHIIRQDPDPETREFCVRQQVKDKPLLERIAREDPDAYVREVARTLARGMVPRKRTDGWSDIAPRFTSRGDTLLTWPELRAKHGWKGRDAAPWITVLRFGALDFSSCMNYDPRTGYRRCTGRLLIDNLEVFGDVEIVSRGVQFRYSGKLSGILRTQ